MNDLKERRINQLVTEHNLPSDIVSRCVNEDGIVDNGKLGIALQTRAYAESGKTAANEGLIAALSDAYWEATDRKDAVAMISLKSGIFKLGGTLMDRKK